MFRMNICKLFFFFTLTDLMQNSFKDVQSFKVVINLPLSIFMLTQEFIFHIQAASQLHIRAVLKTVEKLSINCIAHFSVGTAYETMQS